MTSMRRGEALALRWRDVDLDASSLRVRWSAGVVRVAGEDADIIEGDTKSGKPRVSDLDAATVTVLRETGGWPPAGRHPEAPAYVGASITRSITGHPGHCGAPRGAGSTWMSTQPPYSGVCAGTVVAGDAVLRVGPLPGPLRWSHRLGGWHRAYRGRFASALYWLSGLAFWELAMWPVIGAVWVLAAGTWYGWRVGAWAWRRWHQ